jgi:demethylmenaquinone methyltransferase/2-methoxy-6-polyprenyl-1,4-benzoquinol methylase
MFTEISPTYDLTNKILSLGIDRLWRKKLILSAGLKDGDVILDLCTGTADLVFEFHRYHENVKILGLDISRGMLEIGAQKLARENDEMLLLLESDALNLPLADNSIDVISIAFGLRNLTDFGQGLSEMRRVLKSNGRLLILEFSLPIFRPWRALYLLYLKHIIPLIGGWISGSRPAYNYLHDTIYTFAAPGEVIAEMRNVGFEQIEARKFLNGISILYCGKVD